MATSALGDDLWCTDDCMSDFRTASGREALAQSLYRRWTTDRGMLLDDPNYGTNLTDWMNDDVDRADLAALVSSACDEAKKDERVVDIKGTYDAALLKRTGELHLAFEIADGTGPFSLTVAVSDVTVKLLTVES